MNFENLQSLLEVTAARDDAKDIISYPLAETKAPRTLKYSQLLQSARRNATILHSNHGVHDGKVVIIHLSDHLDSIVWFWSVLLAGGLPAMSTPFSNDPERRIGHITHLSHMLKQPICITNKSSLAQFSGQTALEPIVIEDLTTSTSNTESEIHEQSPSSKDTALLMLTSGSTGASKAVCLSHTQILSAITGKASVIPEVKQGAFMNWIGMDHVASMVEIHLQALLLNVPQVHVHAADMLMEPLDFLNLIDRHRVSRTFAPNFFLAKLRGAVEAAAKDHTWDLSCIRYIASGGEANITATCASVTRLLGRYGAPERVIVPGFGMTETCAGSIFNTDCPRFDLEHDLEFASVGQCMPGIECRITNDDSSLPLGEVGDLEVKGPAVFAGYFNNELATQEVFTTDGWFRTGDRGLVDASGHLVLVGRAKDTVIVNGVKYNPTDIETALENASIPGVTPSFTVCFSSLRAGAQTEDICVTYLPGYTAEDGTSRLAALDAITRAVVLHTGARPYVLPLDRAVLEKSTLGKLSRSKIKKAFESGAYKAYEEINTEMVKAYKTSRCSKPANHKEEILLKVFLSTLDLEDQDFGVTTPFFESGISSIELIKLKRNIEEHLDVTSEIPMVTLMTNPTIRSLVAALETPATKQEYEPTVVLQQQGSKTPLWLIHPGVGEVLIFLNLAKYISDRPVYALRARGFNKGEDYFSDVDDAVSVYHRTIKARQPHGPYALAGYSYGSMLAFEVAKRLEADGDEVRFVGSFNLPPHIKSRMRQLDWTECLLHLSYFLSLLSEGRARELADGYAAAPAPHRDDVLAGVLEVADQKRMAELALSPAALVNWANLAFALQSMAVDYEPSGSVAAMDVFYCTPLAVVAASRRDWREQHLSKWEDFTREAPRFHEVGGEHYTMLDENNVLGFQKTLNRALLERGI